MAIVVGELYTPAAVAATVWDCGFAAITTTGDAFLAFEIVAIAVLLPVFPSLSV